MDVDRDKFSMGDTSITNSVEEKVNLTSVGKKLLMLEIDTRPTNSETGNIQKIMNALGSAKSERE
jgi:hypothetical protein